MIDIYGKPDCVWCKRALDLVVEKNVEYNYHSIGDDIGIDFIIENFPGVKTVPIIVVNGMRIGGYDQLVSYLEETAGGYAHDI